MRASGIKAAVASTSSFSFWFAEQIGARRGSEQTHEPGLVLTEQRRPAGVRILGDRDEVVDVRLQGGVLSRRRAIGEAEAAPIGDHESGECRYSTEPPFVLGKLPVPDQVAPVVRVQQFDLAVSDHLVGDLSVAAPRVPDRRCLDHATTTR